MADARRPATCLSTHREAVRTDPIAIAEHAWHAALNARPPVDWRNTACGESFKAGCGPVAAIYVRINDRHFRFDDDATLPHEACCRRVALSRAYVRCPEESPVR